MTDNDITDEDLCRAIIALANIIIIENNEKDINIVKEKSI